MVSTALIGLPEPARPPPATMTSWRRVVTPLLDCAQSVVMLDTHHAVTNNQIEARSAKFEGRTDRESFGSVFIYGAPNAVPSDGVVMATDGGVVSNVIEALTGVDQLPLGSLNLAYTVFAPSPVDSVQLLVVA